jgi:hypothetical protein
MTFRTLSRRTRGLLPGLALASLTACVEWRTEMPPAMGTRAASRLPSQVRIETQSGRSVVLRDPEIRGDSIFGLTDDTPQTAGTTEIGFALADVRSFEARRPSPARSLVFGMGLTVGAVFLVIFALGGGNS